MADTTVDITAGSGTPISVKAVTTLNGGTVSTQDIQRTGLTLLTATSTAVDAPGDSTNGIDVDVTRLPTLVAGTAIIGKVGIDQTTPGTTNKVSIGTDGTVAATNAGTFVTQENGAALTALQLIDNLPNTIGSTTSGQSGVLTLAAVTTSAPTYTTAQSAPLSVDTTGALRVTGAAGTTQYAEDIAHTTGDSTVFISGIRRDTTPSSSSGTAGDYSAFNLDANGRLYVNSAAYDSGGTSITDTTAHAQKVLAVDAAGAAVATSVAKTTDTITAALDTSAIQNGTTSLTPKFVAIAASSSGNNTILAAVTSKKIRVLGYKITGNGAVNAKFQSGASGTDLTGLSYIAAAGGGESVPFCPVGWFETASNTLLNLNLSGAVAVGGFLLYVEV